MLYWFNSLNQNITKQAILVKRSSHVTLKTIPLCAFFGGLSSFHVLSVGQEIDSFKGTITPESADVEVNKKALSAGLCGNSAQAQKLAKLIAEDWQQNRKHLRCNKTLAKIAQAKAQRMSEYGLVAHNLGGSPNLELEKANYLLPKYYGRNHASNNVEAIAGGYRNAEEVFDGFKRSAGHRSHILGEVDFYLEQDEIGVGFFYEWESPHVEYWAVYIAKGLKPNQNNFDGAGEIPNKSTYILLKSNEKPFEFNMEKP